MNTVSICKKYITKDDYTLEVELYFDDGGRVEDSLIEINSGYYIYAGVIRKEDKEYLPLDGSCCRLLYPARKNTICQRKCAIYRFENSEYTINKVIEEAINNFNKKGGINCEL